MARDKNITTGYQNQNIGIYSSINTNTPYGGTDPNNQDYWITTAEVKAVKAWRQAVGGISYLVQAYEFKVRYRNDRNLKNDMLVKWRNQWFNIFDYDPDLTYQDYVLFKAEQVNSAEMVIPGKLNQTITFPPIPPKTIISGDFDPEASSDSTLAITYFSVNTAVAVVLAGGIVDIVGPGTSDIIATQPGDNEYYEANPVMQKLIVT